MSGPSLRIARSRSSGRSGCLGTSCALIFGQPRPTSTPTKPSAQPAVARVTPAAAARRLLRRLRPCASRVMRSPARDGPPDMSMRPSHFACSAGVSPGASTPCNTAPLALLGTDAVTALRGFFFTADACHQPAHTRGVWSGSNVGALRRPAPRRSQYRAVCPPSGRLAGSPRESSPTRGAFSS